MDFANNISNKYRQKLLDTANKSGADAIKTASKWVNWEAANTTGDLIGNKIAGKITSVSKRFRKELHSKNEHEIEIAKERYISPEKKIEIIDELRSL